MSPSGQAGRGGRRGRESGELMGEGSRSLVPGIIKRGRDQRRKGGALGETGFQRQNRWYRLRPREYSRSSHRERFMAGGSRGYSHGEEKGYYPWLASFKEVYPSKRFYFTLMHQKRKSLPISIRTFPSRAPGWFRLGTQDPASRLYPYTDVFLYKCICIGSFEKHAFRNFAKINLKNYLPPYKTF